MSGRTIREAYRQASSLLSGGGIDEAARQVELLMQEVLGWTRTEFLLRSDERFPDELDERLGSMLNRRLNGEPVQYIIGHQEFYGLPFRVNRAVLIPRPETELLVEAVMKQAEGLIASRDAANEATSGSSTEAAGGKGDSVSLRVLDVGTGSGAIAVTMAVKRPDWRITALDISGEALEVARMNAEMNGVADRISWVQGDCLTPWIASSAGGSALEGDVTESPIASDAMSGELPFDIVVSNPPYIAADEIAHLQSEVRCCEPHTALSGGSDGLRMYARLTEQLKQFECKPRIVAFEVGLGQHEAVAAMLASVQPWDDIVIVPDLAGIMRHVVAVRAAGR